MAESKGLEQWDQVLMIALPIINLAGGFSSDFKPVTVEDLHPYRDKTDEAEHETEEEAAKRRHERMRQRAGIPAERIEAALAAVRNG